MPAIALPSSDSGHDPAPAISGTVDENGDRPSNDACRPSNDPSINAEHRDNEEGEKEDEDGWEDEAEQERNDPSGRESGDEESEHEGARTLVHARRKSKTKAERQARKGGKAGNQGRFRGNMFTFLMEYVDVYAAAHKSAEGKLKGLEEFWHLIRTEFWERFDWKEAREGMPFDGAGLTEEEVMTQTNEVSSHATDIYRCSYLVVFEDVVSLASSESFRAVSEPVEGCVDGSSSSPAHCS